MSRRMNWQNPYRDRDAARIDVSKELLPRHLAPPSSRSVASPSDMTHRERLNLLMDEVAAQMNRIEKRLAAWRDPSLKVPDHVRNSSIAALDLRRTVGERILRRIDQCLGEDETADRIHRAYLEVCFEHSRFLAPL